MGGGLPILRNLGNYILQREGPNKQRKPPSGNNTILKWLWDEPEFSEFLTLVYLADMNDYLDRCNEDFTLFAPPNVFMERNKAYLCDLGRAKARQIVSAHLAKYPFKLKDICGNIFETPNVLGHDILVDGRFSPARVGRSSQGLAFGIDWTTVADIANTEFSVGNGMIHPIAGFLYEDFPQP